MQKLYPWGAGPPFPAVAPPNPLDSAVSTTKTPSNKYILGMLTPHIHPQAQCPKRHSQPCRDEFADSKTGRRRLHRAHSAKTAQGGATSCIFPTSKVGWASPPPANQYHDAGKSAISIGLMTGLRDRSFDLLTICDESNAAFNFVDVIQSLFQMSAARFLTSWHNCSL